MSVSREAVNRAAQNDRHKSLLCKVSEAVARAAYEYNRISAHDPRRTYTPAEDEEIIREYVNNPLFRHAVDRAALRITKIVEEDTDGRPC